MSRRNKKKHKHHPIVRQNPPVPAPVEEQPQGEVVDAPLTEVSAHQFNQGSNRAQRRQMQQSGIMVTAEHFAGPIPSPEMLIKYNEAHPGAAGIIIGEFEKQGTHRRSIESRVVTANVVSSILGQVLAFIILGGIVAGGIYLAANGKSLVGLGTIAAGVIGGLWALHAATRAKREDLAGKRGQPPQQKRR